MPPEQSLRSDVGDKDTELIENMSVDDQVVKSGSLMIEEVALELEEQGMDLAEVEEFKVEANTNIQRAGTLALPESEPEQEASPERQVALMLQEVKEASETTIEEPTKEEASKEDVSRDSIQDTSEEKSEMMSVNPLAIASKEIISLAYTKVLASQSITEKDIILHGDLGKSMMRGLNAVRKDPITKIFSDALYEGASTNIVAECTRVMPEFGVVVKDMESKMDSLGRKFVDYMTEIQIYADKEIIVRSVVAGLIAGSASIDLSAEEVAKVGSSPTTLATEVGMIIYNDYMNADYSMSTLENFETFNQDVLFESTIKAMDDDLMVAATDAFVSVSITELNADADQVESGIESISTVYVDSNIAVSDGLLDYDTTSTITKDLQTDGLIDQQTVESFDTAIKDGTNTLESSVTTTYSPTFGNINTFQTDSLISP